MKSREELLQEKEIRSIEIKKQKEINEQTRNELKKARYEKELEFFIRACEESFVNSEELFVKFIDFTSLFPLENNICVDQKLQDSLIEKKVGFEIEVIPAAKRWNIDKSIRFVVVIK